MLIVTKDSVIWYSKLAAIHNVSICAPVEKRVSFLLLSGLLLSSSMCIRKYQGYKPKKHLWRNHCFQCQTFCLLALCCRPRKTEYIKVNTAEWRGRAHEIWWIHDSATGPTVLHLLVRVELQFKKKKKNFSISVQRGRTPPLPSHAKSIIFLSPKFTHLSHRALHSVQHATRSILRPWDNSCCFRRSVHRC